MSAQPEEIAGCFAVGGRPAAVAAFHGGHINDSFLVTYQFDTRPARYLLQRINAAVFSAPLSVMDNIRRVTDHITARLHALGTQDVSRRVLTLVPTVEGGFCHRDAAGSYWRLYRFIEDAQMCMAVQNVDQAERAARAFGQFQRLLSDLPDPRLHETIPRFHDTPARFDALARAVRSDTRKRSAQAQPEIRAAMRHRPLAGALLDSYRAGGMPERVVHNDAKISNVLFDRETGEPLCVVDFDTVMPGLALYDFGDMVRSMSCTAAEDERDLARVGLDLPLFEALARGYLAEAASFLTVAERSHLVHAGKVITLEQGVRFLTDFLDGDVYYRTDRPEQNLDRCRTQFRLLDSLIQHEARLVRVVESL